MTDVTRRMRDRVGVLGAAPGFIDTIESAYQSYSSFDTAIMRKKEPYSYRDHLIDYLYDIGGMSPAEHLYSADGSSLSAIISDYDRRIFKMDLDDPSHQVFVLDVNSHKWGNRFFKLQAVAASGSMSNYQFRSVRFDTDQDLLVSLPIYAIMAGISVNEINFEAYNLRIKEEFVVKETLWHFCDEFHRYMSQLESLSPEEDNTYKNFFIFDFWLKGDDDHFRNQSRQLDSIFSVIVFVSMGLCFFSLVSSVSANILDQSKEISIMRSCGMKSSSIMRIYVYESLVLVLSCCLCGFVIGVSIGNLMIIQQSMMQACPFCPVIPF